MATPGDEPVEVVEQRQVQHVHVTIAPNSVELSANKDGSVSATVKVYGDTPEEVYEHAKTILNRAMADFRIGQKGAK